MSLMDKFRQQVQTNITKADVHVWGIFGSETGPSFCYTTGLTEKSFPEFLIAGFNPEQGHQVIMMAVHTLKERGTRFENGEVVQLGDEDHQKVLILDARDSVKDDYTHQTGQYYGTEEYEVQQLLIPDVMGRFPNDPACEYYLQPILAKEPLMATSLGGMQN